MNAKPQFADYLVEILDAHGFKERSDAERAHELNLQNAVMYISTSDTLKTIEAALRGMSAEYLGGRYPNLLFHDADTPNLNLLTKTFESTANKIYRSNVIFNKSFPAKAQKGHVELVAMYREVQDLIRTRIVCRYLDGPRFVCEQLGKVCDEAGVAYEYRSMQTQHGYYAWHFYFRVTVPQFEKGVVVDQPMWVELQITTQLAELITSLTHSLYEGRRVGERPPDFWEWESTSPHFRSAYLGHGLHLLEGVIQDFRNSILNIGVGSSAEHSKDGNTERTNGS